MKYLLFTIILTLTFTSNSYSQIVEKAEDISPLLIGELVPDIAIADIDGNNTSTHNVLNGERSVLLVYRGGWCAYCNAHLSEVGLVESEIMKLGYKVIAFSPDSPEKLKLTMEKNQFKYNVYSDASGKFIQSLGVAFKAPDRYSDRLAIFSDELNPGLLPVPSLFVLDEKGTILFEYISPDYRQRIGADMLISVLKELNKEKEQQG